MTGCHDVFEEGDSAESDESSGDDDSNDGAQGTVGHGHMRRGKGRKRKRVLSPRGAASAATTRSIHGRVGKPDVRVMDQE